MNEPEQYQPTNPDEGQEAAAAAPVLSSSQTSTPSDGGSPAGQSSQPEFGQYSPQPEYGAMTSQYPSNYNPYMYGAPETPKPVADAQQVRPQSPANPYIHNGQPTNPYAMPNRQQEGQPNTRHPYVQNPYQQPGMYPINLDDPQQNPMYGRWDSYAIVSFVFALLLPVPVIPAVMGAVAMWRTKKLHMKGYALGVAALIINVLYTLAVLWLAVHGISTADLYNQMMQYMFGGTGSGDSSGSINA